MLIYKFQESEGCRDRRLWALSQLSGYWLNEIPLRRHTALYERQKEIALSYVANK